MGINGKGLLYNIILDLVSVDLTKRRHVKLNKMFGKSSLFL